MYTWGWLDFLSSIPAVAFLRVARSARIFRIIKVLRAIRGARILSSMILKRKAENALYAMLMLSMIFVVLASLSVLQFEKATSGANIKTAEDALWWAVTTVTTVGYGDRYPVTREGRVIATFLMVVGVGLFGSLTGATASWFVSQKAQEEKEKDIFEQKIAKVAKKKIFFLVACLASFCSKNYR